MKETSYIKEFQSYTFWGKQDIVLSTYYWLNLSKDVKKAYIDQS